MMSLSLVLLSILCTGATAARLQSTVEAQVDSSHPLRVACVGDSITFGYNAQSPNMSYPSQLQELLGSDYEVGNFGHSGSMLTKLAPGSVEADTVYAEPGKSSYWETPEYNASHDFMPDVVVIQLGANDASKISWIDSPERHTRFRQDFQELINSYKALPSRPHIFLSVTPPCFIDGQYGLQQFVINDVLPELIPAIAAAAGLPPPIDVAGAFRRHCPGEIGPNRTDCDWFSGAGMWGVPGPTPPYNDIHPSDNGYGAIAAEVAKVLRKATGPTIVDFSEPPGVWNQVSSGDVKYKFIDGKYQKCCCRSNVVSKPELSTRIVCELTPVNFEWIDTFTDGHESIGCKQLKGPGYHSWNNMGRKYKNLKHFNECAVYPSRMM